MSARQTDMQTHKVFFLTDRLTIVLDRQTYRLKTHLQTVTHTHKQTETHRDSQDCYKDRQTDSQECKTARHTDSQES